MLHSSHEPETRAAAAHVLGLLGVREAEMATALTAALDDPESAVRLQAERAIGLLRIESALPKLLQRISDGGPEADVAAQAAAHLGAKGIQALQRLMGQVAPGLRRRIASALAAGGTATAGTAAVDALLDSDPGVVDAAVRSLLSEVGSLSAAQKRGVADRVLELLHPRKAPSIPAASESALLRLLAALGDSRAEPIFWARISDAHDPALRATALQALGTLSIQPTKDKFQQLIACATDRDFRVAAPALMLLKHVPVAERNLHQWLALLDAPDVAARRFALEKLEGRDSPALATALLRQFQHPDRTLREEALRRLTEMASGRELLVHALLDAPTPEDAWLLARAQAPFASQYGKPLRSKLLAQACTAIEAGDRRADPWLFLLREIDARELRDQLEARAEALRKKKAYAAALLYYRLLTRDPACGEALRFATAACALKVSEHDLSPEQRAVDPALQQLARLIHSHDVDPAERLRQARWLAPEDLYYAGFHFAEGERAERDFAKAALQLAIQRSPKSKLAKDAKSKLRSAGLA